MKKAIIYIVFSIAVMVLCAYNTVSAQKRKLESIKYDYVELPSKILPDSAKTYRLICPTFKSLYGGHLGGGSVEMTYHLPGYKRVDTNEDIRVEIIYLTPLILTDKGLVKDERVKKQRGRPDFKYTHYYYDMDCSKPKYSIRVFDKQDNIIYEFTKKNKRVSANFGLGTGYDSRYRSIAALEKAWSQGRNSFLKSMEIKHAAPKQVEVFIDDYCLKGKEDRAKIYYAVPRRNTQHSYDDLNQALEHIREALKAMSGDKIRQNNLLVRTDYENFYEHMTAAVQLWEEALQEENLKDKKSRINKLVAEGLRKNLLFAYAHLHDFELAYKQLEYLPTQKITTKWLDAFKEQYEANLWRESQLSTQVN